MEQKEFITKSAEETVGVGKIVGSWLDKGSVVALWGDLGAGKTTFTKGIALALGIPPSIPITSPTFTIVNEYNGFLKLYHVDLYRISSIDEVEVIGLREILCGDGVTVIEWPDRISEYLPAKRWDIIFEIIDDSERVIRVINVGHS